MASHTSETYPDDSTTEYLIRSDFVLMNHSDRDKLTWALASVNVDAICVVKLLTAA